MEAARDTNTPELAQKAVEHIRKQQKNLGAQEIRAADFTCADKKWRVVVQRPVVSIREYARDGALMIYACGELRADFSIHRITACYKPPAKLMQDAVMALRKMLGVELPAKRPAAPRVVVQQLSLTGFADMVRGAS